MVPPTSLNDGQQVDLMLARMTGGYYQLQHFDELPTPFRTVAVDLKTAERVVLDRGSLAQAMRATMSLPGVFPPVEMDGRVLVDGGALDSIPADVVREMGAGVVIAVDVGYVASGKVDYSLFALMGQTVDSMMRANTRRALQAADLVIAVDVEEFRVARLAPRCGPDRPRLQGDRETPRRAPSVCRLRGRVEGVARGTRKPAPKTIPIPRSISTAGIAHSDVAIVRRAWSSITSIVRSTSPSTRPQLQRRRSPAWIVTGVSWQIIGPPGNESLLVRAREKPYAPVHDARDQHWRTRRRTPSTQEFAEVCWRSTCSAPAPSCASRRRSGRSLRGLLHCTDRSSRRGSLLASPAS